MRGSAGRAAADTGAVSLIQRLGSAANLNIHLHCLVLDGVYRRTESELVFQQAPAPSREALEELLRRVIQQIRARGESSPNTARFTASRLGDTVAHQGKGGLKFPSCLEFGLMTRIFTRAPGSVFGAV